MKMLLALAAVSLLCSCAMAPRIDREAFDRSYADPAGNDPRQHPQFYMDDSEHLGAWTRQVPQTNR